MPVKDETWEPHSSKVKSGSPQAVLTPHLLVTNLLTLSFLQPFKTTAACMHSCEVTMPAYGSPQHMLLRQITALNTYDILEVLLGSPWA